jgi:hypothetical protein
VGDPPATGRGPHNRHVFWAATATTDLPPPPQSQRPLHHAPPATSRSLCTKPSRVEPTGAGPLDPAPGPAPTRCCPRCRIEAREGSEAQVGGGKDGKLPPPPPPLTPPPTLPPAHCRPCPHRTAPPVTRGERCDACPTVAPFSSTSGARARGGGWPPAPRTPPLLPPLHRTSPSKPGAPGDRAPHRALPALGWALGGGDAGPPTGGSEHTCPGALPAGVLQEPGASRTLETTAGRCAVRGGP